jgi:hypothetical protein
MLPYCYREYNSNLHGHVPLLGYHLCTVVPLMNFDNQNRECIQAGVRQCPAQGKYLAGYPLGVAPSAAARPLVSKTH